VWHHTLACLLLLTKFAAINYGPCNFPKKLIPVVILKAVAVNPIPLYGMVRSIRDWL